MTTRDRIVLMVIVVIAVLGAAWVMAVSPERKEATKLQTQVDSAKAQLSSAESQLAGARAAQSKYASAYTSVVRLGKAVPADAEVPSLVYQLSAATQRKSIDFESITANTTPGSPEASSAASAKSAGFSQMPFTFLFSGDFFNLEHLFNRLTGFTVRNTSGALQVSGRLLTVQSVSLVPEAAGEVGGKSGVLKGTVTATAYQLPAGESLTGGATASSPTGSTQAVSSSSAGSSATAPATVRVTP